MGPAELEFKKNKKLSWSQQMEVVITVLLQANHQAWIEWVISVCLPCPCDRDLSLMYRFWK